MRRWTAEDRVFYGRVCIFVLKEDCMYLDIMKDGGGVAVLGPRFLSIYTKIRA